MQMVLNFLHQGAAINALAVAAGADLRVVDVGVATDFPPIEGLVRRRVCCGTKNLCDEPAMSREETIAALRVGIEMADAAAADDRDILGFGEMGIGNTTPASAIAALLSGLPVNTLVGRGAGADDEMMFRKIEVVERAVTLHGPHAHDALEILSRVGGFEIAAMTGYCIGGAAHSLPVVVDGFISSAAAALAVRMEPNAKDYLFAAHCSVEQGHAALLALIGQRPLLNLEMRLGEGTGGALAMHIIRSAVAAFTGMATFESAGVSGALPAE
jgi:nicotinate-nucleotide--dimethylbenzimidazole phosphoribosyltransferase